MGELAKATLTELNASNQPVGQAVPVQFNPASLRMQFSNRSAGGAQAGAPTRQQAGEGSVSLNFELHFDSADEGSADAPVSVLRKTAAVQRYVRPRGNQPGEEAPPRVQFEWGAVKLQGVMDSLSLDIELFAFDGTPLRARCAVSLKGQDSAYALAPQGAGAGAGAGGGSRNGLRAATERLLNGPAGQVLNAALAGADAVVRALDGESLAQLAARNGRNPADWRSLGAGSADPTALRAGQPVTLPRSSGNAPGGDAAPRGGALGGGGLSALRSGGAAAVDESSPQALTRAGGMTAARTQQREVQHGSSAGAALRGFGLTARTAGPGTGSAGSAPAGIGVSGAARPSTGAQPGSPATADDRPYGFGLPLKPRRAVAPAATPSTAGRASSASPCRCGGAPRAWRSACRCGG